MKRTCLVVFGVVWLSAIALAADGGLVIVAGTGPGPVETFAAEELQGYLEKICGAKFPILPERVADAVNLILAPAAPDQGLGADGFLLQTEGADLLLIGGGPRGRLYAAYEFLERHLGVRWFGSDAGDEVIPKRTAEDVCAVIRNGIKDRQVPSFYFREVSLNLGGPTSLSTLGKLRFNAVMTGYGLDEKWRRNTYPELQKRGIDLVVGGHDTYRRFLPPEKHFVAHPEWSILYKGKRAGLDNLAGGATFCTTNPEALAIFLSNLTACVKDQPEAKYIYPWPSDAGRWCECEECRKRSVADRLLALDIAIAEAVKKVRPDMTVIHFAYGSHMDVPADLRPPKEMAVSFSAWGRDFAYALDEEGTRPEFRAALLGWSKICNEAGCPLFVHSKLMRLYGIGFVLMPYSVAPRDMRYLKTLGVDGFDFHRGNFGWWTKGLNDSVIAKLAWNCDADVRAITDDYFRTYWAPVSDEVKAVYESVEKALPHRGYWWTGKNPNLFHTKIEITMPPIVQPQVNLPKAFLDEVEKYNENSIAVLSVSLDAVTRLRAAARDPVLEKRLAKLETTLQYVALQREGIRRFLLLQKGKVRSLSASAEENIKNLQKTDDEITELEALEQKIQAMCTPENRQAGVLWDNGESRLDMVKAWREMLGQWKAQFEPDRKVEKDIVWQIGKFYATFEGDLGPGEGLPAHVTYRIPDDWKLGRDMSDFPQRHNQPSKGHACRLDIVFKAEAGRYLLTVAHGTSAVPETVRVLLDGQEIGAYTTQNKERSVRSDFPVEIKAQGEHTITLTEPDEAGGGYELDAIRLIRSVK